MRAVLILASVSTPSLAQQCGRWASSATSPAAYSFDVSALSASGADYQWADTRAQESSSTGANYTYTFNICRAVNSPPTQCSVASAVPGAVAYQWAPSGWCTDLGGAYSDPVLSLLDPADPSYGFNMTYPASAAASQSTCARAFHLIFRCGYDGFPVANAQGGPAQVSQRTLVTEVQDCHYEAYSWSTAGCPLECPIGANGGLCSNLGICGYDSAIQSSRCFCDDGYIAADCAKPASPVPSGSIAGAFFGGAILAAAGVLGTGFYLFRAKQGSSVRGGEGFYAAVA